MYQQLVEEVILRGLMRHPRENGDPEQQYWIPACAGMTERGSEIIFQQPANVCLRDQAPSNP
jgi:hypothetical protein